MPQRALTPCDDDEVSRTLVTPATVLAPPASRVRRATERTRRFDARHPLVWDVVPVAVLAAMTTLQMLDGSWQRGIHDPETSVAVPWLIWALFSLPLVWRRRHPDAVLLSMAVPAALCLWFGLVAGSGLAALVALYGVVVRSPLGRLWWFGGLVVVGLAFHLVRWQPGNAITNITDTLIAFLFVTFLGLCVRVRKEHLRVQHEQAAETAISAERARIAREMHDIIGHNLAVITSLADGGAYAAAKRPERAAQALDAIGDTSRQALAELRKVLGVLRDENGTDGHATEPLTPQPGLGDLEELLARVREAGLTLHTTVTGLGPDGTHGLSAGSQLTIYRTVQESLTNVLKHAGPHATAQLDLEHRHDAVLLTITNSTAKPPTSPPFSGHGIAGMRERSAAYGGTLDAGPLPENQWRIHLRLPRDEDIRQ